MKNYEENTKIEGTDNESTDISALIEGDAVLANDESVVEEDADANMDETDVEVLDIYSEVDTGCDSTNIPKSDPRVFMYTQLESIVLKNFASIQDFENHIRQNVCTHACDRFAYIVHNKDKSSVQGQQFAKPHIHVVFHFKNPHSIVALAKSLNDYRPDGTANTQAITIFRNKVNNAFSYLCHKTAKAANKFQYPTNEVVANFDYQELMAEIASKVANAKKGADAKLAPLLELLRAGEMTKKQVCEAISASTLGTCVQRIRNVDAYAMERAADKWRKEKQATNKPTIVIWICGDSGTGKSSLGRDIVKSSGEEYYVVGSSRGIWENYQGEHVVLLDELRPNCIESYRDFLSILDAYQERAVAPSRFYDKELMLDVIVITSVLSPYEFYKKLVPLEDREIDPFHQLERRISTCIIMEDEFILNAFFDDFTKRYVPDMKGLVPNVYSEYNNPDSAVYSSVKIFNETVYKAISIARHYAVLDETIIEDETVNVSNTTEQISDSIVDEMTSESDAIEQILADISEYDILEEILQTDFFDGDSDLEESEENYE